MSEKKPDNVFTHVNALSSSKEYTFDEERAPLYVSFLVNKAFSQHVDTILYAEEANKFVPNLPTVMQYDFYYHLVPKRKRFGWMKRTVDDRLPFVARYYNTSYKKAEQYIKVLTEEDLNKIIRIQKLIDSEVKYESNE